MGTPDFAVKSLEACLELGDVVAVVTQPDKPRGRGQDVSVSPVKQLALAKGLPVLQPVKMRGHELRRRAARAAARRGGGDRVREDPPARRARGADARLRQRARLAVAALSRGGAHSVGDRLGGRDDRRVPDADGRGHGHRARHRPRGAAHLPRPTRRRRCTTSSAALGGECCSGARCRATCAGELCRCRRRARAW